MSKSPSGNGARLVLPEVVIDDMKAGIDWLTVTAKTQENRADLFRECDHLKRLLDGSGYRVRPWMFKGYTGFSVAGLRWGTRLDSDIAMLSGVDAQEHWYVCGEWAEHCSRVDLAVTVGCQKALPDLAVQYYEASQDGRLGTIKYKSRLFKNSDGGQTFYVGSRASRAHGRIYDKGREAGLSDQPGKLWRYEVEFKKPLAQQVWKQIQANKYLPIDSHWTEQIAQSIAGTVFVWFQARNVPPIFSRRDNPSMSLEIEARLSSDEVSLNWLTTQVQPTVLRLVKRGQLHRVKEALGLTDEIQEYLDRSVD